MDRVLDHGFWCRFLEIEGVVAVKVAPFNRYQTLEVAQALADSGRAGEVARKRSWTEIGRLKSSESPWTCIV